MEWLIESPANRTPIFFKNTGKQVDFLIWA